MHPGDEYKGLDECDVGFKIECYGGNTLGLSVENDSDVCLNSIFDALRLLGFTITCPEWYQAEK